MPYLIGVPKQTFLPLLNKQDHHGDAVVVDLEGKTFESPFADTLPADVYNFLHNRLKSSTEVFLSGRLSRAFLQTNALRCGKYAQGFVENNRGVAGCRRAYCG